MVTLLSDGELKRRIEKMYEGVTDARESYVDHVAEDYVYALLVEAKKEFPTYAGIIPWSKYGSKSRLSKLAELAEEQVKWSKKWFGDCVG